MAKKKISKEDIAPKDLFSNVIQGAKDSKIQIDLLTKAVNALKTSSKGIKKDIAGQKVGSTKGQKDFNALQVKANQTAKAKLQIDKQLIHHKTRLSQIQQDENKAIRTTIQAQSKLTTTQQKSLGTLQKIEISSRQLRAERSKLNLETKKGQTRLKEINIELDKNNMKIRQSGDAMKKQRLNVGNYTGAMGGLRKMLMMMGGAFAVFRIAKGAFNIVKDFEQSQANLASVLGKSVSEMKDLTEQAKLLGSTTTFTASQVAELHLEFAKLGFSQKEIEGMTTATLALAEATGSELGESASVVGATMRGFGLSVGETQRVTDVMAKSFSSSSLDMSKFSTAMSSVAPVAKLAGKGLEETTALLGTLTDRGIDASTAGTGLRNMFLQANKHGLTFDDALEKIKNSTDQTSTAMKLFGTRGATLGVILSNNSESIEELTLKLLDSDGAAQQMADTQRDTLGGSIKLLQSAWEGLVLKFEEGTGTFGFLKDTIAFLADNLEMIIKLFIVLGTVFGVYALINKTTKAIKAMNMAMNANPWMALASVIIAAVVALKLFMDEMSTAEKIQENFKNITLEANKAVAAEKAELGTLLMVAKNKKLSDEERIAAIEKLNKISPEYLGNLNLENIATSEGVTAIKNYIKALDKKALAQAIASKKQALYVKLLEAEASTIKDNVAWYEIAWAGMTTSTYGLMSGKTVSGLVKTGVDNKKESIDSLMAQLAALDAKTAELMESGELSFGDVIDANGDDGGAGGGTPEKKISLLRQIEDAEIKLMADSEKRDLEAVRVKFARLVEDTKKKKTKKKEFDKWEILQDKLKFEEMSVVATDYAKKRSKLALENKIAISAVNILEKESELNKIADIFENFEETEALRKDIDDERIKQIMNESTLAVFLSKGSEEDKQEIVAESVAKIEKIKKESVDRTLAHEIEARKLSEEAYTRAENEKLLILLRTNKSQEEIDKKMLDFQIEQLREKIAEWKKLYPKLTDEILAMEIELENKIRQKDVKADADEIAGLKDMQKIRMAAIDAMTNYFVQKSDERIAKLNEEISAHQKQADFLKQLAIDGNIEAKDSLAEENRLIAEAEQKKAEEEKRKQQVLMVSAILSAYVSNIDSGQDSVTALANAIASKAVLDQFVAGIGSFFEGTEDTGKVNNPLDSKGGRIAVLHNNERVITAKQNKKIGGYSNDQVANIVEQNRLGKLAGNAQIGDSWESHLVVEQLMKVEDKLDQVNKTIENKEVSSVELGAITQTSMNIVERRKKAGNRTISTYKVKV